MNKALKILVTIALPAMIFCYLAYSYGYTRYVQRKIMCSGLEVSMTGSDAQQLPTISAQIIANLFVQAGYHYLGKSIVKLPLNDMESLVEKQLYVKNADVYVGIDGILHVVIALRRPILRVFYTNRESFYIDDEGYAFNYPSMNVYSVPIVNGNLSEIFSGRIRDFVSIDNKSDTALTMLVSFGKFITQHPFWSAQIEQIFYVSKNNIELIPRVGAHVIRIGTLIDYGYKLDKLMFFYLKAASKYGWNKYKSIDVSICTQVICEKR